MENKLERKYGLFTAICMVVGIVIGSGVFIKGGKMLALTNGNMLQGVLVVALVGIICIICSLVFGFVPIWDTMTFLTCLLVINLP